MVVESRFDTAMTLWNEAQKRAEGGDYGIAIELVSKAYPILQELNHPLVFECHSAWVKWYALFQHHKETLLPQSADSALDSEELESLIDEQHVSQSVRSGEKAYVEARFEELSTGFAESDVGSAIKDDVEVSSSADMYSGVEEQFSDRRERIDLLLSRVNARRRDRLTPITRASTDQHWN